MSFAYRLVGGPVNGAVVYLETLKEEVIAPDMNVVSIPDCHYIVRSGSLMAEYVEGPPRRVPKPPSLWQRLQWRWREFSYAWRERYEED